MRKKRILDLRSDTITTPDKKMVEITSFGTMGDEFYDEASCTTSLENYCAEMFGKEKGLFLPSGMMANLVAAKAYTNEGDSILTHSDYYINYFQSKPLIKYCGINICTVNDNKANNGLLDLSLVSENINTHRCYQLSSEIKTIWIENTINSLSGKIYPINDVKKLYKLCKSKNIPLHIDGARILNACVAKDVSQKEYGKNCDSLSFSFSKGLSAPFGSVLVGNKDFIKKAKLHKKEFGGGLHQSDVISSMCFYALKNNIKHLKDDNKKALKIAEILQEIKEFKIIISNIETNIIMLDLKELNVDSTKFNDMLSKNNILLYPWNKYVSRIVTSSKVEMNEAIFAAEQIVKLAKSLRNKVLK